MRGFKNRMCYNIYIPKYWLTHLKSKEGVDNFDNLGAIWELSNDFYIILRGKQATSYVYLRGM